MQNLTPGKVAVYVIVALIAIVLLWHPLLAGLGWLITNVLALTWFLAKVVLAIVLWFVTLVVSSVVSSLIGLLVIGGVAFYVYHKLRIAPTRAQ